MRVAREVFEHLLRAAERLLRVAPPVVPQQLLAQGAPELLVGRCFGQRLAGASGLAQRRHELAAEDP